MITSGLGLKAWPLLRPEDANWRRNLVVIPPLGVERVLVRSSGLTPANTFWSLFSRGETMCYSNQYGGGADKNEIWISCRTKPTRIYFTVQFDCWMRDNPQGYTELPVQGKLLAGNQENWRRGDSGAELTWGQTVGIYHELEYVANNWRQKANPITLTKAIFLANGNTMYDPNGSGFVELTQDAGWAAWQPGNAGWINLSQYPLFPTLPSDQDNYWLVCGNGASIAWARGDYFHTADRRTKVSNIRLESEAPPWPDPVGEVDFEGANLVGYYEPNAYAGGLTYPDRSGWARHLTFNATPTLDASYGGCLIGGPWVSARTEAIAQGVKDITISMWVYTEASKAGGIFLNGNGANGYGLFQGLNNNGAAGNNLLLLLGNVAWRKAVTGMTGLPKWQLVTIRLDATGGQSVWVNGTSVYTATDPVNWPSFNFYLVALASGSKVGLAAAWESALSDAEILANFNATKARYGL